MAKTAATTAEKPKRTTRGRTRRRMKYITGLLLCSDCTKTARKEIVGEARTQAAGEAPQPIDPVTGERQSDNLWVRCTKCHNTMLVNLAAMLDDKPKPHANLTASECTPYTPQRIYAIGEAVYHKEWDDIGSVVSKEVTAGGRHAIIVNFDKMGEKKLLENFVIQ
ncbi:MAG: hypothetical protein JSS75_11375 [Bacteroidetes bacterium]|nr:hypothetical protein [Bacteroidota bacterium]